MHLLVQLHVAGDRLEFRLEQVKATLNEHWNNILYNILNSSFGPSLPWARLESLCVLNKTEQRVARRIEKHRRRIPAAGHQQADRNIRVRLAESLRGKLRRNLPTIKELEK
jgi:hypothetical protein